MNGEISSYSWYEDEISPEMFRTDLNAGTGDIIVWINSPGGCVFAAAQIYNMLKEYPGKVTVKIDSIAASAASVIAMAGDEVCISPVGYIMIHNPATYTWGDAEELGRAKAMLEEIKEGIINAYHAKTGRQRAFLSRLMDEDSYLDAHRALRLGFVDRILYVEDEPEPEEENHGFIFSRTKVTNCLMKTVKNALPKTTEQEAIQKAKPQPGTSIESLDKRLSLLFR